MAESTIKTQQVRKITVTKTTNSSGDILGTSSDVFDVANAIPLQAYLHRDSYSVTREIKMRNYGNAGWIFSFRSGDNSIVSSQVTYDVYYVVF